MPIITCSEPLPGLSTDRFKNMSTIVADTPNVEATAPAVLPPVAPVAMSFPSILLNPRNKAAHILRPKEVETVRSTKMNTMIDGKTRGKRHVRRFDNVTFRGNPHIVAPARTDYQVPAADVKATFPVPIPSYLRVSAAPSATHVMRSDPANLNSAYAGRFTLSLRGLRKDLRQRGGGRARTLVEDIENAIQSWLDAEITPAGASSLSSKAIDRSDPPTITEVTNNPLELIWYTEDPFARWIIHCVSRWHGIVSFSKDVSITEEGGSHRIQRQTHLLRPNSRHPDPRTTSAIYTPTATDLESSIVDTEDSDYSNLADSVSSMHIIDSSAVPAQVPALSSNDLRIEEESEGHSDAESAFSLVEHPQNDNQPTLQSDDASALSDKPANDEAARPIRPLERVEGVYFQPNLSRTHRADSSPSRSPMRPRRHRQMRRVAGPARRSQAAFRSTEPPTTFMAYVYGSSA